MELSVAQGGGAYADETFQSSILKLVICFVVFVRPLVASAPVVAVVLPSS